MVRHLRLPVLLLACGAACLVPAVVRGAHAEEALPALQQSQPDMQATAEGYRARGVLEPEQEATLSSELDGRVTALPFDEGQRFKKGAALVELDCGLYRARLAATQADREVARLQYESDKQLAKLNSIGDLELRQSAARLRKADADVKMADFMAQRCTVSAPYDGRVVKRLVHEQESVPAGRELIAIVGIGTPDIRLIVPSHWLAWLKAGDRFVFTVDETAARYPAHVKMIGARIDAVSQTLPVIAAFDGAAGKGDAAALVPGMSGTGDFGETAPRTESGLSQ
ncbi:RND family efflux transporter, MFP subunit [Tistlia consotensis]|uniref:RND family efflux transporter, MFP subunit n=1 Tax=Tistlia consotensis USBA 355 TaxID=560819 RepID=A0A1Y6CKD0_9PROT|nr:efflux RND transporter periplasmic adaptor subunit [Tistlia consotensis]SMF72534.1 RND family efflux transporter, MFP subunit [Tistlia consotensis USBA 355]SNS09313.1 RND family efflux transporter, MFP subunit [Tistlia consotensis]